KQAANTPVCLSALGTHFWLPLAQMPFPPGTVHVCDAPCAMPPGQLHAVSWLSGLPLQSLSTAPPQSRGFGSTLPTHGPHLLAALHVRVPFAHGDGRFPTFPHWPTVPATPSQPSSGTPS